MKKNEQETRVSGGKVERNEMLKVQNRFVVGRQRGDASWRDTAKSYPPATPANKAILDHSVGVFVN